MDKLIVSSVKEPTKMDLVSFGSKFNGACEEEFKLSVLPVTPDVWPREFSGSSEVTIEADVTLGAVT